MDDSTLEDDDSLLAAGEEDDDEGVFATVVVMAFGIFTQPKTMASTDMPTATPEKMRFTRFLSSMSEAYSENPERAREAIPSTHTSHAPVFGVSTISRINAITDTANAPIAR